MTALAKKEVASQKQTKKLRRERDEAVQERDALKARLYAVSSEPADYKKAEEDKRYFSRDKLKFVSQQISKEEQLKRNLQNALTVIDRYGLRDEYDNMKSNAVQRKNELE